MVTNSKQTWQVGEVVKIGFLTMRITALEATPGDHMPDAYHLCGTGKNADRAYKFVPHFGLTRITETGDWR